MKKLLITALLVSIIPSFAEVPTCSYVREIGVTETGGGVYVILTSGQIYNSDFTSERFNLFLAAKQANMKICMRMERTSSVSQRRLIYIAN